MIRRVVITGLGIKSPNADDTPSFLSALKQGKSGISKVESIDTSKLRIHIAGEIKDFATPDEMDRVSALALEAATEAYNGSGLKKDGLSQNRIGVAWGTLAGGILSFEEYMRTGIKDANLKQKFTPHSSAGLVAKKFGVKGTVVTISTACASGTNSIGYGFDQIRYGNADMVIAGGSDTLNISTYAGFHSLRSLDPECCRPFDKNRQGLVVGEGAGALILEDLEHALARDANIYAEVLGYGLSSDAYHETSPDPEGYGAALSMTRALEDSGIDPGRVSYINAHGTGTKQNDQVETLAIKKVFNKKAYLIPISSTKSMIGHLMGAAGAVEAIATVLALKHSFLPPTINYNDPDPDCDLDYVPNKSRNADIDVAISNSFAFGGNNASLVLKRYG